MGWVERLRGATDTGPRDWPARPDGTLLWFHIADGRWLGAIGLIMARINQQRPGCCFLITSQNAPPSPLTDLPDNAIWTLPPHGNDAQIQAFMRHWHPDALLWVGRMADNALLSAAAAAGLNSRIYCAEASETGNSGSLLRRLATDKTRLPWHLLGPINALNATAARALRKSGAPDDRIAVSGPLQDAPLAPGCNEADREALMAKLAGRQVWLADGVTMAEEDIVIAAHEHARRGAHRLLLIMRPDKPDRVPDLRRRLRAHGNLVVSDWTRGDLPERHTDVLIVDGMGEEGLWPRVAPLSFIGGTLTPGAAIRDPRLASILGSVVLVGPMQGPWLTICSQLTQAGAARIVRDVPTLAAALIQLIAPDRAASMALAGWQLLTEGAELTDMLVDDLLEHLDQTEGRV